MKPVSLAAVIVALGIMGPDLPVPGTSGAFAQSGESGPWRHAREPRDRGMSCDALETEITEIDTWQAEQASRGSGPSAEQGTRAAEVIARRTGNNQTAGILGDARRMFGGGNDRNRSRQARGRDGMAIADKRRAHLMSIYDSKSCWQASDGGYHNEVSKGPWLHPRKPRDRGMSCSALETEIGYVDTWLEDAESRGITPDVDLDEGLGAAQNTAWRAREYETSGIIGDVRSVINTGPRRDLQPDQEQLLVDTAYLRRNHLMNMFEGRACWEKLE